MGGQSGRKDQDSDSAAHLPLFRATASMMGTWPDRLQYLGQPLISPWFLLKEALVLHSRPAPHPVGLVRSLWVELAHLEPTEAQWEGEGTAVGEDDWGSGVGVRGVSGARIPFKAAISFLSMEMHGEMGHVRKPVSLTCSRTTSSAQAHSRARGRACSWARAWSSCGGAGAIWTTSSDRNPNNRASSTPNN